MASPKKVDNKTFKAAYGTAYDTTSDEVRNEKSKTLIQFRRKKENSCMVTILTFVSYLWVILTLPISIWGCIKVLLKMQMSSSIYALISKVVQEYERAVIFRLGRLRSGGAKGPGLFFVLPCIDTYKCVDLRTGAFDVPPQEILTRDSVTVSVDAVVYYQVP